MNQPIHAVDAGLPAHNPREYTDLDHQGSGCKARCCQVALCQSRPRAGESNHCQLCAELDHVIGHRMLCVAAAPENHGHHHRLIRICSAARKEQQWLRQQPFGPLGLEHLAGVFDKLAALPPHCAKPPLCSIQPLVVILLRLLLFIGTPHGLTMAVVEHH
eukprot:scaffold54868_cov61-Phaeocystis_antarctica.AAC.4